MKVFGGYGEYYDQMKLNVAISSYGGQYWQECWYALMDSDPFRHLPGVQCNNRYCEGPDSASKPLSPAQNAGWIDLPGKPEQPRLPHHLLNLQRDGGRHGSWTEALCAA
jgi:hypothetical protein